MLENKTGKPRTISERLVTLRCTSAGLWTSKNQLTWFLGLRLLVSMKLCGGWSPALLTAWAVYELWRDDAYATIQHITIIRLLHW